MVRVGFIGLGNMGLPMAINLVQAGYEVHGFDTNTEMLEAASAQAISACENIQDAIADQDVIVTMLPNGKIVLQVLEVILANAKAGTLLIDCSTIDVASAKLFHKQANDAGLGTVDCPVSGGISGAQAGTLTFMMGGNKQDCQRAAPLLDVMGQSQVHCGEGGAGQAAKICNNMLLATTMIGVGEAFNLGKKLGLDPQALFDVMSASSGSCWSINKYCPLPDIGPQSPADNDYKPGFATSLMIKDTGLAQAAADDVSQATPMGKYAWELYQQFAQETDTDMDFSGIITWLENRERGKEDKT